MSASGRATLAALVGRRRGRRRPSLGLVVLFVLLSLIFVAPMYWMFLSSMRPQSEIFGANISLLPTGLSLDNYERLLAETPYVHWFFNSVVQSLGYASLTVALCTMGGYALAKYRFRGRTVLFVGVLASQMLPFQLLIVPLFLLIVNLRLVETYFGAVVPLAAHPIGLFFMRQYMLGVQEHMLDAARVDGANEYRIFWSVVLPNVRPALATMFILFALEYWNNLLWPLIVFAFDAAINGRVTGPEFAVAFERAFASVSQEIFAARWAGMSPIDRQVVAVVARGTEPRPSGDIEAEAQRLGVRPGAARQSLRRLAARGHINRLPSGHRGRYMVRDRLFQRYLGLQTCEP